MPNSGSWGGKPQEQEGNALVALTARAYQLAISAAQESGELMLGSSAALTEIARRERELDELDREVDERVAVELAHAALPQVREKLACLKCMIDLERIGDLLLGFSTRADSVRRRLGVEDLRELGEMLKVLLKMLSDAEYAFCHRDHARALEVLRSDQQVDRLHNLVVIRHLDPGVSCVVADGIHIISMAQAIERAADHAKNTAEEVCHLVSGHTVRHLLRLREQSAEQLYLEHLGREHHLTESHGK